MSELRKYAINCFRDEAQAILDLIPLLTDDFDKAVDLIYNCHGKLITTGVGKSGNIAAKIASTLASTGTPAFFIDPINAYHGDLGMISEGDIVLVISNSGNTEEIIRFIPLLKERKIPVIAMSGNPESLLVQYSDCYLNIAVKKEACLLNLTPTSSTTAALAMGDAVACTLIKLRNFQPANFAKFHPGGSLGQRLQLTVKDLMISENIPVVNYDQKLSDVIGQIDTANLGIMVAGEKDEVIGFLSNIDIIKAQLNCESYPLTTVRDIMNFSPLKIKESSSKWEAIEMMKMYNVPLLLVVNEQDKFTGVISLFNCL